ncbi:assimilatory sulfite reductase (NADPH) flavoprotein subunit [Natronoflexus pectinivorans]|uniref:assimilatory sulfite reductase (NADPH) n=1 Tax=Natronoflexus pectinivorans TaxID=682526 RepID=A0A4R2GGY5_9BACT|nr:assimilatory sulfite reductase (NADPH) flavoprotein subunit [Natronoflexus pectinivorans]TCO07037.1 sulfite reductase (NADPH) flavoprotein alpha-component [Natronoflexus pectinivorans]
MSDNQLFKPEERSRLQQVLSGLNREQLLWLGGYISAAIDFAPSASGNYTDPIIEPQAVAQTEEPAAIGGQKSLTILFGSHSGNSQRVATLAHQEAERQGIKSKVKNMEDYNARFLKDEEQVLVVISTHGEGEPPLSAQELYEKLSGKKAPDFTDKPFAVIALGDSSYKHFCKTGYDFHSFLEQQGGKPLRQVAALDTDFDDELGELIPSVVKLFASAQTSASSAPKKENVEKIQVSNSPVEAPVMEKVQLNGRGSDKETWHLEISTDKKGLVYQPGDALEVYANNNPELVKGILRVTGLSANEQVTVGDRKLNLEEALTNYFELTIVTPQVVKKYATLLGNDSLNQLLDDADKLDEFLEGTDVLDLLQKYPVSVNAEQLLSVLRKLPPRAYSISSSPAEVGDEVHITVGAVRYEKENRERGGVCSTFIADRLGNDDTVKVKIRPNNNFRLPSDGNKPIIMVGAGTGVAPYRAFIQHRAALGDQGRNWLIFGDRHFTTDFLYQVEWLKYKKNGLLTRLDVAFSRDQEEKRYVQHRMKRHGKELYRWIAEGAHFYVCGDMKKMAGDVKSAFLDILQIEGNMSREESENFLTKLRKEGRYQEDVY